MKSTLVMSGALAALLLAPTVATADESVSDTEFLQLADATADIDAAKLVGEEVYDAAGEKVGEIDAVMVDAKGKVSGVIIDVSGWLQSEKLVSVPWKELKTDQDGRVVSSLTKETAESAETYAYKDPALRKQVLTESGERYEADTTVAAGTGATVEETDNEAGDGTIGTPVMNADGSLNASQLIGLDVNNADDKVGDIGEVVLDKGGKVEGVVVDVGGFLGIATHPVLLSWKDVTVTDQDGKTTAMVNVSKERLEQMPTYKSSKN
jgi:sporulation protein YlmC with PRC-barrel domain